VGYRCRELVAVAARVASTVPFMGSRQPEYTALARRWDSQWEVFVLNPVEGLIGLATVATFAEVEYAARMLLGEHLNRPGPAHEVRVSVIQR
jgi:hypothetical protein